jgi:predicted lipoprotein with Yx(FWY)xxD motif
MTRLLAIVAMSILLGLAGCGGDDDSSGEDADAPATTTASKAPKPDNAGDPGGLVVEVTDSEYGQILVDGDGRTLYAFDKETTDRSECFGACAEAWPPSYSEGRPRAGRGVKHELLGTTDHEGKQLVTYNGHPLYYYIDEGPNEVLCQGVDEFGGLWLVVDPSGDPIQ